MFRYILNANKSSNHATNDAGVRIGVSTFLDALSHAIMIKLFNLILFLVPLESEEVIKA